MAWLQKACLPCLLHCLVNRLHVERLKQPRAAASNGRFRQLQHLGNLFGLGTACIQRQNFHQRRRQVRVPLSVACGSAKPTGDSRNRLRMETQAGFRGTLLNFADPEQFPNKSQLASQAVDSHLHLRRRLFQALALIDPVQQDHLPRRQRGDARSELTLPISHGLHQCKDALRQQPQLDRQECRLAVFRFVQRQVLYQQCQQI